MYFNNLLSEERKKTYFCYVNCTYKQVTQAIGHRNGLKSGRTISEHLSFIVPYKKWVHIWIWTSNYSQFHLGHHPKNSNLYPKQTYISMNKQTCETAYLTWDRMPMILFLTVLGEEESSISIRYLFCSVWYNIRCIPVVQNILF